MDDPRAFAEAAPARHVTEPTAYVLDDGWLVDELPSGRVTRMAPPGTFRAEDYPVGRPVPGPPPPFRDAADLDWTGCPLVEIIPGKVSGQPLLIGTRLPVDALLVNAEAGLDAEEVAEQFAVTPERVRAVLAAAEERGWRVAGPA